MSLGIDVLLKANQQYPMTKLIWPAIAIAAAVSIIASFELGWQTLLLGTIFVFVSIILFQFIAYVATAEEVRGTVGKIAALLLWSFSLFLIGFVALVLSCVFFSAPITFAELVTSMRSPLVTSVDTVKQNEPELTSVNDSADSPRESGNPEDNEFNRCLQSIPTQDLSVSEVESIARECKRKFR